MYLTSASLDLLPDILDHTGELIGSDMRMGIRQDRGTCPKLAKDIQYLIYRASFLATGIQLSIRISAGTALTKTII